MHRRYTHTQTYTHTHTRTLNQYSLLWCYAAHRTENAYTCVRVYVKIHIHNNIWIYIGVYICIYMHIHVNICVYICIYVYMCICIYIQIYTQTDIHMSLWTQSKATNPSSISLHTHTNTLSHTSITHSHTFRANTVLTSSPPTHIIYIFKRAQDSEFQYKNIQFSVFCFRFFYNFCFFYNFLSQHFQCWPAQLCRCSWTPFSKKNVYLNACLQRHGAVIFDTPVEVPYCTEIMKKGGWKHDDVPQLLKHTYKKNTYRNRNRKKMSEKGNFFLWRVDSYRDWVRILQREYGIVVICQVSFAKREPCNNRALLHMRPSKLGSLWTIALY